MNINSLESHADWCAWSKNLDALPYEAAKVVFQKYKKMYCQCVKPFSDLLFQTDYLHSSSWSMWLAWAGFCPFLSHIRQHSFSIWLSHSGNSFLPCAKVFFFFFFFQLMTFTNAVPPTESNIHRYPHSHGWLLWKLHSTCTSLDFPWLPKLRRNPFHIFCINTFLVPS